MNSVEGTWGKEPIPSLFVKSLSADGDHTDSNNSENVFTAYIIS